MKYLRRLLAALLMLGPFMQLPFTSLAQEPIHTIDIHAHRFAFSPDQITLKKGETVKLQLFSDDVPHILVVPGLGINQAITKAHSSEVTVTPTSVGDFPGKCGRFCGSGHGSMTFTVHVTE